MAKETWILKDSFKNYTYVFPTFTFNFTANGEQFIGVKDIGNGDAFAYVRPDNSDIYLISNIEVQVVDWEKYRKITLEEPATGDVLTWLNNWADKYEGGGDKMMINVTKSAGVVLKTEGKYCDQDITVVPVLEEKSVTPTESAQEIVPSDGNCGISKVNVGAVQTETKTITPTTSQQTFTPTSGKYFKQVICQAIQIETKTVTPSASTQFVQPSSGKYLANVTVTAVPSQSKTVTPTKSVQTVNADSGKWLSSVTVNAIPDEYIQPSGSQDITANGTYDVTDKASVNVNVPTASAVEEVATASAMNALLVEANVGKYYKYIGTTDSNYTNGDLYLVEGGQ